MRQVCQTSEWSCETCKFHEPGSLTSGSARSNESSHFKTVCRQSQVTRLKHRKVIEQFIPENVINHVRKRWKKKFCGGGGKSDLQWHASTFPSSLGLLSLVPLWSFYKYTLASILPAVATGKINNYIQNKRTLLLTCGWSNHWKITSI